MRPRDESGGRIKTYKKATAFWKHGKHASVLPEERRKERESKKFKHQEPMYDTVQEAFESARKKTK